MKQIQLKFTHLNYQQKINKEIWDKQIQSDILLASKPMNVETYDELVMIVAQIAYYNRNLQLFFRGQKQDFQFQGKTTILPSIYRKASPEQKLPLKENFEILREKAEKLKQQLSQISYKLTGTSLLKKYPEICWSILQHYEVCKTPLLDLTHSLHVACSFAFYNKDIEKRVTGTVYVFGLPMLHDSINFYTYDELLNIKLLGICPPEAKRPYFQEGYLAGPFPNYKLDEPKRIAQFDFARRLLAKFIIPMKDSFWGEGFQAIPEDKLYQQQDRLKEICDNLK